ncbi:MAG: hypothetical protein LBD11_00665 [Candidatus Peribacteria bacterium]|jgi:hypothetical protein|nr:hypothetical protein [Candidatus Peribacteria bacterium]
MLNFDGYIVGFNQIYFDNPVSVYNANLDEVATTEAIKKLNEKSIDLYMFVRTLTGRRNLGLNRLATDLVGESKNLE